MSLSPREFGPLDYFMLNLGEVVTREELLLSPCRRLPRYKYEQIVIVVLLLSW